jgi:hypothetical protein
MAIAVLAFIAGAAIAEKPEKNGGTGKFPKNPNSIINGTHYNLNLIAKQDHFQCPGQSYYLAIDGCPLEGCGDYTLGDLVKDCPEGYSCIDSEKPIYGNVIFMPREQCSGVPEDCDPITVLIESGRKGPKPKAGIDGLDANALQVIDWCTESFPDNAPGDGPEYSADSAIVRLPAQLTEDGYVVVARITGKPGKEPGEPTFTITPDLVYVEDDEGNDLFLLMGLVASNGDTYQWENDEWTLVRTDTTAQGKGGRGNQGWEDITGLFKWSGRICYLDETDCVNECTNECWCCCDTDGDAIYDHCAPGSINDNLTPDDTTDDYCDCSALTPPAGCTYQTTELWCTEYVNHWVFDIADFVGYLWDIDTSGAYVVQVRFYPLGQ